MKLMRYNENSEAKPRVRLGILVDDGTIGDLRAGYAHFLQTRQNESRAAEIAADRVPSTLVDLLASGDEGWTAMRDTLGHLTSLDDRSERGPSGEPLFSPLAECRLHAPLRPAKLIAVGRNYREHLAEVKIELPHALPSAWIKATSSITGPARPVIRPACVKNLDYETELAIVIGKKAKNIPESNAYDVIAGYTVVNDISARDIVKLERKEGNQLLGKMFDSFAPMGPWMVTADEIPNPMNLKIMTRVNGEIRQNGNTGQMIWSIPKLIAYLSQMTLQPGDVIATGTPSGVAMGHSDSSWYLKPGDVLESEVEMVGMLRNPIEAASDEEVSWKW